jgi:hypothetical protein
VRLLAAVLVGLIALGAPAAASPPSELSPSEFLPSSVSWLDARQGSVFGYAPCGEDLCPQLLATVDGGDTWQPIEAPPVKLPDNHNQVRLMVADPDDEFVTDGTTLWATNDKAATWYPVELAGLTAPYSISKVVISHGTVLAVASSLGNAELNATRIYSGAVGAPVLRPLAGFEVIGGYTYGDLAVDGDVLQVYLGADYATARYGFSLDGVDIVEAPLPCPVENVAMLGGIKDGRPIALCNGSGGSPQPGSMTKQVFTAPQLGGTYVPSNPAPAQGITQTFGVASPDVQTIGAVGGSLSLVHSTFDAGNSWTSTTLSERGFGLFDLQFVTPDIGYVVDGVPNASEGSAVYRSTDAGRTWLQYDFFPNGVVPQVSTTRW